MYQIQIGIGHNFPIGLILLSNGTLTFVKTSVVGVLYDQPGDKEAVHGIFTEEGFSLNDESFSYKVLYAYKEIPVMLRWLQQQKLIMPENVAFAM